MIILAHKYVIDIPTSTDHDKMIDENNGNT